MMIEEARAKIKEAEEKIKQIVLSLPLPIQGINIETDGEDIYIKLDVRI